MVTDGLTVRVGPTMAAELRTLAGRKRVRVRRLRPGLWTVAYWQESPGRHALVICRYRTFDDAIRDAAHVAGYFRPPPAA